MIISERVAAGFLILIGIFLFVLGAATLYQSWRPFNLPGLGTGLLAWIMAWQIVSVLWKK